MQEMQETEVQSLGREDPLEEENGSPLQYSCLENSMDRGACWGYEVSSPFREIGAYHWVTGRAGSRIQAS